MDVVEKGGNYGWNVKEGTHCLNAADEFTGLSSCPIADNFGNPLIDPVIEAKNHDNPEGGTFVVVVGGNVYRGHNIPGMQGEYIFGNLSNNEKNPKGEIYLVHTPNGPGLWPFEKLPLESYSSGDIWSFCERLWSGFKWRGLCACF